MKKLLIPFFLLLFLVFLPFNYALPDANLTQPNLYVISTISTLTNYSIPVQNTGDLDIYNITLSQIQDMTFSSISKLTINETGNIIATVFTTSVYTSSYASLLSFTLKSFVTEDIKTVNVAMNEQGFFPSNITANMDDTITFTNMGSQPMTITELGFAFNLNISPSNSVSILASNIGSINIFDSTTNYMALISIQNRTKENYVHNSLFDRVFPITISSTYPNTSLSLALFQTDFILDWNQQAVSVLRINNLGNYSVRNIQIAGEWLNLSNSSVSELQPSQQFLSFFTVSPTGITQNNETGKQYTKSVTVTSDNANPVNSSFNVYIKTFDFTNASLIGGNGTKFIYLLDPDAIREYCRQFPDNCPTKNITVDKLVNRTLYPQISETDVETLLTDTIPSMQDTVTRMENRNKIVDAGMTDTVTGIQTDVNNVKTDVQNQLQIMREYVENLSKTLIAKSEYDQKTNEQLQQQKNDMQQTWTAWGAGVFLLLIVVACIFSIFIFWRNHENKSMNERRM